MIRGDVRICGHHGGRISRACTAQCVQMCGLGRSMWWATGGSRVHGGVVEVHVLICMLPHRAPRGVCRCHWWFTCFMVVWSYACCRTAHRAVCADARLGAVDVAGHWWSTCSWWCGRGGRAHMHAVAPRTAFPTRGRSISYSESQGARHEPRTAASTEGPPHTVRLNDRYAAAPTTNPHFAKATN